LYQNIVANTLHSSVNGLLLIECMCLCRMGVLCMGVRHPAKQRFGVGRHNSYFKNSSVT